MDMASIYFQVAINMMVIGLMEINLDRGSTIGQMVIYTLENGNLEKEMAKGTWQTKMEEYTQTVVGKMTNLRDEVQPNNKQIYKGKYKLF